MKKIQTILLFIVLLIIPINSIRAAEKTANDYYEIIKKYADEQPYQALIVLKEANAAYPEDQRFINGIKERTLTIANWSQGSHERGNYLGSIYGYDTIIDTKAAPQYVRDFAVRQKALASDNKGILSLNDYMSLLSKYNEYQPYDLLRIYSEAQVGYPNDNRLKDGINKNSNTILEWSIGSHQRKNYEAAIYGYNTIVNAPDSVYKEVKDKAILLMGYAKQGKEYYTADEYYVMTQKIDQDHPYDALSLSVRANRAYPKDKRFINLINSSAATILEWSIGSHSNNNFEGAIYGYDTIKDISLLPQYIKNFAIRQAKQAVNHKPVMTADEYNSIAMQYDSTEPYKLLKIYNEALVGYPKNEKFKEELSKSAKTILEWSNGSHSRFSFGAAIYGYDTIINSYAPAYMKKYAERHKLNAEQKKLPLTLEEYLYLVKQTSINTPYELLIISNESLISYPNEDRFITAVNDAASIILDWSIGSHIRGNYSSAIYGYKCILDASYINDTIRMKAIKNIEMAQKGIYSIIGNKTIVLDAGHNFGGDDGAYGNGYAERTLNMQVVMELQNILQENGVKTILTRKPGEETYESAGESLAQRATIANESNADLFLSIHHDSNDDSRANGTSAFYSSFRNQLDTSDVYVEITDTVNIRRGSPAAQVIAVAKPGERYAYISEQDKGFLINYKGTQAWVSNGYSRAYDPTPSEAAKLSKNIAETISENISSLGLRNRGITDRNLYVTRSTIMPSVLVEVGFISNTQEINKIAQPSFQKQVAMKIWNAIVSIFKV
ncbi:N-acetylmuramoyl-L-alanine amidase [Clostridium swellfunianum]|uniref:N-acetylmuramoyl-L-alanine amidase n=1 Tax=Clostridium swellfunianum TaxID=1367462 RepID=UPI00202F7ACC|nr:N-acetylmuramoyl-L-alanine amidase [Clostridium swellfunianum]MCM0647442.1 N-acetylmuramoyl-L-alanine amidase [Clostridium swellfunianum]